MNNKERIFILKKKFLQKDPLHINSLEKIYQNTSDLITSIILLYIYKKLQHTQIMRILKLP